MNNITFQSSLSILFLFFVCMNISHAQIPNDFEYLQHTHLESRAGSIKLHNGDTYYVSHNGAKPMTTVYKITADKEVENILEFTYWSTQSKLFETSDTSFQFVLYNLFEYDIFAPGFVVVNVNGNEITNDTITNWGPHLEDNPQVLDGRLNLTVENIEKDNNGEWISFVSDSIYRFTKNGISHSEVNNLPLRINDAFSNPNGDLYGLSYSRSDDQTIISNLNNNTLDTLLVFNQENTVINMLNDESGHYLMTEDKLIQYSVDFATELNNWDLGNFDGAVKYIDNIDGSLEVLTNSNEKYSLYKLTANSESELLMDAFLEEGEEMEKFIKLDGIQYLFFGIFELEEITRNVFIRNVNSTDLFAVEYPKMDVELSDFEILQSSKDTLDINVSSSGDTTIYYEYTYDFEVTLINNGTDPVNIANVFTSDYYPDNNFGEKYFFTLADGDIAPGESKTLDTTIIVSYKPLTEIRLALPGANFMFNGSVFNSISGRVISSISNIESKDKISIYPNPAQEIINIESEENIDQVSIYNMLGQPVYLSNTIQKSRLKTKQIDISLLDAGTYVMLIKSVNSNRLLSARFIKS